MQKFKYLKEINPLWNIYMKELKDFPQSSNCSTCASFSVEASFITASRLYLTCFMFSVETHWINQLFAVTDICKSIFVVYTSYVLWLCMSFWPIVYFSTFYNLHKIRKSTINTTPTVVPLGTINKYRIWQLILGPIY